MKSARFETSEVWRRICGGALASVLVGALPCAAADVDSVPFEEKEECGKVSCIGEHVVHRGWGLDWPHNAMVSIRKCWQEGLIPEVDAMLSKDRKLFALHGNDKHRNMPWSEISKIDVGVKYGEKWKGVHPPLWEEIMSEMKGHPKRRVMLDPKDAVSRQVVEMARKYGVGRQMVFLTANPSTYRIWKRAIPESETRFVVHPGNWRREFLEGDDAQKMLARVKTTIDRMEKERFEGADVVKFVVRVDASRKDPFSLGREFLKNAFAKVHAAGKKVGVWVWYGGERKESYRLLREIGVDNFGSDYPEVMLEFLEEERARRE